ncbi:hypothetical protein AAEU32_10000 [Pseudoalteromonas sp. SSDWG2]|uniref:hypothetical protein n=1 Tax=Pseudoalteromonas sp. SSDWG2 TaxID=3139391 RepID=UPI003BA8D455
MVAVLIIIWLILMVRSGVVEYKYYQSVKQLEPAIWEQLGSPVFAQVPMIFISPKGSRLLKQVTNETVIQLARKHRVAGIQFVTYVCSVLLGSIVYFKLTV